MEGVVCISFLACLSLHYGMVTASLHVSLGERSRGTIMENSVVLYIPSFQDGAPIKLEMGGGDIARDIVINPILLQSLTQTVDFLDVTVCISLSPFVILNVQGKLPSVIVKDDLR